MIDWQTACIIGACVAVACLGVGMLIGPWADRAELAEARGLLEAVERERDEAVDGRRMIKELFYRISVDCEAQLVEHLIRIDQLILERDELEARLRAPAPTRARGPSDEGPA